MSVNKAATNFLKQNFERVKAEAAQLDKEPEVVHEVADMFPHQNVIISRVQTPRYYAGTKRNGQVIWTHDPKFARAVSENHIHMYEEQLGLDLFPEWPYARYGDTRA